MRVYCKTPLILDMWYITAPETMTDCNDFAPIYDRRAKKLCHVSLATVFRHGRLTFQPILYDNLESPVLIIIMAEMAVV